MHLADTWHKLNRRIEHCDRCTRLRAYCAKVGQDKRRAFMDWNYWAKPVPNFGDPKARMLIVGLAPAAHGANRTGRMFTGDRSGDFLYEALHRTGFANQPQATDAKDGLTLTDCAVTAAGHCAPPANKPTSDELALCEPHLADLLALLTDLRAIVCLGKIGHDQMLRFFKAQASVDKLSRHPFAHGTRHEIDWREADRIKSIVILDCFHPSPQNTFTGKLTMEMLVDVFKAARAEFR